MKIFHNNSLLKSKNPQALVIDDNNRIHIIDIKHTIGEYFLAQIHKQTYAFKLEHTSKVTYRETGHKLIELYIYYTDSYRPISGAVNVLREWLETHNLKKMSKPLKDFLSKIQRSEDPENFEDYDINELLLKIKESSTTEEEQEAYNVLFYWFKSANIPDNKIVRPVQRLRDYLDINLTTTEPHLIGTIFRHVHNTDRQTHLITNSTIGIKTPMLKLIALMAVIGAAGIFLYVLYDGGHLSSIGLEIPGLPTMGEDVLSYKPTDPPDEVLVKLSAKYPSPELLVNAVDNGDIDYSQLPLEIQDIIDEHRAVIALQNPPVIEEPPPPPPPPALPTAEEIATEFVRIQNQTATPPPPPPALPTAEEIANELAIIQENNTSPPEPTIDPALLERLLDDRDRAPDVTTIVDLVLRELETDEPTYIHGTTICVMIHDGTCYIIHNGELKPVTMPDTITMEMEIEGRDYADLARERALEKYDLEDMPLHLILSELERREVVINNTG